MKPLCIYHGNCADGFTAAWAVWKAIGGGYGEQMAIELVAGVYQDDPPAVKGRDVIIVDFSYKWPVLEKMMRQAKTLVILDHHASAVEELAQHFPTPPVDLDWPSFVKSGAKVAGVFKLQRSGAGLAWDFFHPGKPAPRLVQYVEDRDLWHFKLPQSRAVNANIFAHAYDLAVWEQMYWDLQDGANFKRFAQGGEAIERKHHKDVAELVKLTRRRMTIGGHDVPVANLPYTLSSDAGHLMAQGERFAACYWDTEGGRVFSLRSADDGLDVSEIAVKYGGGGHKRAAGFRVDLRKLGALA